MSDPEPADVTAGDTVAEGLAAPEVVRVVGEALEDAALTYLSRDLGTIHRDDIAKAAIAALAPTVTAMVTAGQAEALEAAARRIEALMGRDSDYDDGIEDAVAVVREGGDR